VNIGINDDLNNNNIYLSSQIDCNTVKIFEMNEETKAIEREGSISKGENLWLNCLYSDSNGRIWFSGSCTEPNPDPNHLWLVKIISGYLDITCNNIRYKHQLISATGVSIRSTINEGAAYYAWNYPEAWGNDGDWSYLSENTVYIKCIDPNTMEHKWQIEWNDPSFSPCIKHVRADKNYLYATGYMVDKTSHEASLFVAKYRKSDGERVLFKSIVLEGEIVYTYFIHTMDVEDGEVVVGYKKIYNNNYWITGIKVFEKDTFDASTVYSGLWLISVDHPLITGLKIFEDDIYFQLFVVGVEAPMPQESRITFYSYKKDGYNSLNRKIEYPIRQCNGNYSGDECLIFYEREEIDLVHHNASIDQARILSLEYRCDGKLNMYDYWIPRNVESTIAFNCEPGWSFSSLPVITDATNPSTLGGRIMYKYECPGNGYVWLGPEEPLVAGVGYWADTVDNMALWGEPWFVNGKEILYMEYPAHSLNCWQMVGFGTYPGWVFDQVTGFETYLTKYSCYAGYTYLIGGLTDPDEAYWVDYQPNPYVFVVDQTEE
jgi:hypothetical protein